MLALLREHPNAPIYRNHSGHRLAPEEVERARQLEDEAVRAEIDWHPNQPPQWVKPFVERCLATSPFYRRYGAMPRAFTQLPTLTREDLARDMPYFVPDEVDVERLINFRTSGTSGHPLLLASHPLVAAQYLGYHKRALRRFGVRLRHGRDQVGVILLGVQSICFTYVSITPTMDDSGLAKINLHPNDWRSPDDRAKYLEAMQPEVIAGDPISFAALLDIDPRIQPAALLSTSMTLMPALCDRLRARYGCPVLDLYSMNEAGPIAVFDSAAGGHVLLQQRMYIEILDDDDQPVATGQRGEVTLTGGFNFCLPLVRYRTGDHAALERRGGDLVLIGLEGRPPVKYRRHDGRWLNNIEITHALRPLPLVQFSVHQDASGHIAVDFVGASVAESEVEHALQMLLGTETSLRVRRVAGFDRKIIQYTSALPGAQA
ncbi:MAG TPA: AMP-binding protein [Steroidobacter sp.]|uniref:AMP-binding protein n=1 Tax=Steroidobacter sp. TaxID=1978227 RepID=UPI002ED9DDA1